MGFGLFMLFILSMWAGAMLAIHVAFEKRVPSWMDHRRPRPAIALAIDVLSSPVGWSSPAYTNEMSHASGLTIGLKYDQTVNRMEVNGQNIELRQCEMRALTKAMKRTARNRDALKSEEALRAWAGNVQTYVDNVVSINRKAS